MIARLRALLMAIVIAMTGGAALAQTAPFDGQAATYAVRRYLQRNGVPGAVAVVTEGDHVVWRGGFGHDADGRALTANSRLPICSVSKSFVALAVMQQVEAGRVALDAPVVRYVPEFRLADPRGAQITVRQLLAHRSGLSDRGFREKSVRPTPRSLAEAVAALRDARLAADPGARRSYTNPNYWVAARLVEVVSGQPFDAYMRRQVFQPLGMSRTSVWNGVDDAPDVARGHVRVFGRAVAAREPAWFLGGACGVVTTADDMGRWLVMHTTGRSPVDGAALVSPASLQAMHDGLGWNRLETDGRRSFAHNGIMFTYSADQVLLPDLGPGRGVAVIADAGVGLAPLPADELAQLLVAVAEGRPAKQPPPTGLIVDAVLGLIALAVLVIAVLRWRSPPRERPMWRRALGIVVDALPVAWLAFYPAALRSLLGRDLDWRQALYAGPMLFVLVAALAVVGAGAIVRRLRR
ncbi:MAG: hypothetical protein BGN86_01950 [Caulobacterales bacterium 68-7]|nr:MAG: hypothetical protein BGN86_01950 [Caulobacterales bacterium 68-7]